MSETVHIKKKDYEVLEVLGEHSYKIRDGEKIYFAKVFGHKTRAFDNFTYAYKRLHGCGVTIPRIRIIDKKQGFVIMDYIDAQTVFDDLRTKDLTDDYFKDVFNMNWVARSSKIALNFDPRNFRMFEGHLYYMPFTFDLYNSKTDFTKREIYLWFYTKEFVDILLANQLPIEKSRIKKEYERNKEIVLKVVEFYR